MTHPSFTDLFLAFRQAKTALYYERRGTGLLDFARFEDKLDSELPTLQAKLASDAWFDKLRIGTVQVVPKRLDLEQQEDTGIIRIGAPQPAPDGALSIQLRLAPSPEFATAEMLYLRKFGPFLDGILGDDTLGYRLDLRKGKLESTRRWAFEYWPKRYQQYRNQPMDECIRLLTEERVAVTIVSADLSSFYDSIDPSFLISDHYLTLANERGPTFAGQYMNATQSLLRAYARFREQASRLLGRHVETGIPIASLTSRLTSNLALETMDCHVRGQTGVQCYRRYVDDLIVVATGDAPQDLHSALQQFLPLAPGSVDSLRLDCDALMRPGSEFTIQLKKVKIHHLQGPPGADFVSAVQRDLNDVVSRGRSFIEPLALDLEANGAMRLTRTTTAENSPLRVFREADRTHLHRYTLSRSIASLERASVLVGANEVRPIVKETLDHVVRVLDDEENWVERLDMALRLLKLSLATREWESCEALNQRLEKLFGTTASLQEMVGSVKFRDEEIESVPRRLWTSLRNYLHDRRHEAVAMAIELASSPTDIATAFPDGLTVRGRTVKSIALRRRAATLSRADLRSLDREDDTGHQPVEPQAITPWLERKLSEDRSLTERIDQIRRFADECYRQGHACWAISPVRLFLSTRPPSYFDVARRMLRRVEQTGFTEGLFEGLREVVNAIRGTNYVIPVGIRRDNATVYIPWEDHPDEDKAQDAGGDNWSSPPPRRNPRLVLGNFVCSQKTWDASATRVPGRPHGAPLLTVARLLQMATILSRTYLAALDARRLSPPKPTVLVLPELSVPRRWARAIANYAVKNGRFGVVMGLEYSHSISNPWVLNQALAVLPGPYQSVAVVPWTKKRPATGEGQKLKGLVPSVSYPPSKMTDVKRLVVRTDWGAFSVLICSELIEVQQVAELLGRIELLLCPAWNPDTSSYDHLIQSVGFQLHAMVAIANVGHISDCRAWGPRNVRWERDLCRLIERKVDDVVYVDLPVLDLVDFHQSGGTASSPFGSGEAMDSGESRKHPPKWKPLPPYWPKTVP